MLRSATQWLALPMLLTLGAANASEIPTACTPADAGACECSQEEGFTTYRFEVDGQDRCFTIYVPPEHAGSPLPVVITMDSGQGNNALRAGGCEPGEEMTRAADAYGFAGLCATTTDGIWTFGNDGVVNDETPLPCDASDSKDIVYLQGLFDTLDSLGDQGVVESDAIFAWGFSENSMFAAYAAFCFPEKVARHWQGGSGLFVKDLTDPLPQMEGACRKSDFLHYGHDCQEIAPCEDCEYFPVYPEASVEPQRDACIMAYEDDPLFPTAEPMYDAMTEEGHHATLLAFPDTGRGHTMPYDRWPWLVGCMEVVEPCSEICESDFLACAESGGGTTPAERLSEFSDCSATGTYPGLSECHAGCAPTLAMLRHAEQPCIVDGVCEATEDEESCPLDCLETAPEPTGPLAGLAAIGLLAALRSRMGSGAGRRPRSLEALRPHSQPPTP